MPKLILVSVLNLDFKGFDIESDHLNSEHFDIDFGHLDPHQGYLQRFWNTRS